MIDILIPLATDEYLHPDVVTGVSFTRLPYRVSVDTNEKVPTVGDQIRNREGTLLSRNRLLSKAVGNYVLFLDSDVVLKESTVDELLDAVRPMAVNAAAFLTTRNPTANPNHIPAACVLVKTNALCGFKWVGDNYAMCPCFSLVRHLGYATIVVLTHDVLVEVNR